MASPVWHFLNGVPVIPVARIGTMLAGDGTTSAPSYSFASDPGDGWYMGSSPNPGTLTAAIDGSPSIGIAAAGTLVLASGSASIFFGSSGLASPDVLLGRTAPDVLSTPDRFLSTGATAGIGYGTGAGGAQTQGTSKATTVVSNTITGEITMHNATLNAATAVTFALTNSAIATGDMVLVQHVSAGTLGAYVCQAVAGAGTANITVTNRTAGNLGEAIVLKYIVFKAVTS